MSFQNAVAVHQENLYVKNVYRQIAKDFDNTRGYSWSWVRSFIANYINKGDIHRAKLFSQFPKYVSIASIT